MQIKEELRRIIVAAPNLPFQMMGTIALLVGVVIFTFKGIEGLNAQWEKGTATPKKHSQIQERIREKEPDYFFKIYYLFTVANQKYEAKQEFSARDHMEAQRILDQKMSEKNLSIWYSPHNPNKTTFSEEQTNYILHFIFIGFFILILAYFRWLFLKYYELEIEK
ncbi:DUF3592 domain-containing protein [Marivirga salinae]|uniref:DUF3592 domain-containing protein n=1 Tax=Marivirga salinarum TaxID=3059078 RepID=A0AA49GG91_9BACT|nr:DUF3592 domain-containing protein [Marivirga sp. BDSF4-3]WKK74717.1 DUF3592 domain-containing protein [Marivirga sp. BDSF4-3]